ncbi:putative tyrosinase-like protein tyr-1 [Mytilus trossulus]|uniref:putative tyrosinase-like protein tyr-1 n=1 Tax=Mytilus trossulus TaxID=6551 RepID=UPI003006029C
MKAFLTSLVIFICSVSLTLQMEDPNGTPSNFVECMEYEFIIADAKNISQIEVQKFCKDLLVNQMESMAVEMKNPNITNYIKHLARGIISEIENANSRQKRSVFRFGNVMRREIREPPYDQVWGCYARGVRRLKNSYDVSNTMNTFDVIASLHTGAAIPVGHDGPGFFSWHKAFLRIMEFAIGCPLPYWDTTLDFPMDDPTQSIVWSPKFFGNGYGAITSGPFANLPGVMQPIRNINSAGWLMSRQDIQMALSKPSYFEFTEPSPCYNGNRYAYSMECLHDGTHVWLGGTAEPTATASFDPIFYPLHAFVDKIFGLFRRRMIQEGNAVYPDKQITGHAPRDRMLFYNTFPGIESLTHEDGYGENLDQLVSYTSTPSCPNCAGSDDLYCDTRQNICVSRTRQGTQNMAVNRVPMNTNDGIETAEMMELDSPVRVQRIMNRFGALPIHGPMFGPVGMRDRRTTGISMRFM